MLCTATLDATLATAAARRVFSVGSALLGSRLPFGNFVGCVIVPPAVAAATVNLEHILCEHTAA